MSHIIVTGAAGFIGSHLCERLLARGDSVLGIDSFNDYYDPKLKRGNVAELVKDRRFTLVEADIRDGKAMEAAFSKAEAGCVVHLAAMAGVRYSIQHPSLYTDVNIHGTVQIAEMARRFLVPSIVFGSSSSVYGANPKTPFSEEDRLDTVQSPYGATKLACEILLKNYAELFSLNVAALRFFTVYGPRQRPDMAIHKFVRRIRNGEPLEMYGDGSSIRDYTYVDDIVEGILAAMQAPAGFDIYNLGRGETIRLAELIRVLEDTVGKKAVIKQLPDQPGDVPQTFADISKAKSRLHYTPQTDVRTGVKKYIEWYNSHHK